MKVGILGFGVEGQAALRYFRERQAEVTVVDENPKLTAALPEGVKLVTGPDAFNNLTSFDLVVRGPAVRPDKLNHPKITSVTKLFFEHCPAPIIGITGSKGKGTTSSLIFEMLTRAGIRAHLAGNIGVPALDILPDVRKDDVVVLELSSFQLWDLTVSPRTAVVLMIEPDHMDVHADVPEYVGAKANIARWQKKDDVVIFHPTNEHSAAIAKQSKGAKLRYAKPPAAHIKNDSFVMDEQVICSVSDLLLPGKHNVENACAAITAAWQYTQDTTAIAEALREFSGLPHRLKYVAEKAGVTYYDDSIATTPGSAIAALRAFEQPKILILGGSSKGADFNGLAAEAANATIRKLLLIGDEAETIQAALEAKGVTNYENLGSHLRMHAIVELAANAAEPGDVVILSPACASFGMFANYKDRGEQFVAAVKSL